MMKTYRNLFTISSFRQISKEAFGDFPMSRCSPRSNRLWLLVSRYISLTEYQQWRDSLRLFMNYGAEDPPLEADDDDESDVDDEIQGGNYALNVIMDNGYLAVELTKNAQL